MLYSDIGRSTIEPFARMGRKFVSVGHESTRDSDDATEQLGFRGGWRKAALTGDDRSGLPRIVHRRLIGSEGSGARPLDWQTIVLGAEGAWVSDLMVQTLRAEMDDRVEGLRAELREISKKIDALVHLSKESPIAPDAEAAEEGPLEPQQFIDLGALEAARVARGLAAILNQIADGSLSAPQNAECYFIQRLDDSDAATRAAAARALSAISPELACQHLPDRINIEPNRRVVRVLEGALRAACL